MDKCHSCGCGSSCASCGGCAKALVLTQAEIDMLYTFATIPFLPVARKAADMTPIYLEEPQRDAQEDSLILACLEKKGLIDIDYHQAIRGFDYSAYHAYPLHGSMALTARGQSVLETLELQGIAEEV